jgi:hypothetical protein
VCLTELGHEMAGLRVLLLARILTQCEFLCYTLTDCISAVGTLLGKPPPPDDRNEFLAFRNNL